MTKTILKGGEPKNASTNTHALEEQEAKALLEEMKDVHSRAIQFLAEHSLEKALACIEEEGLELEDALEYELEEPIELAEDGEEAEVEGVKEMLRKLLHDTAHKLIHHYYSKESAERAVEDYVKEWHVHDGYKTGVDNGDWLKRLYEYHYAMNDYYNDYGEVEGDADEYILDCLINEEDECECYERESYEAFRNLASNMKALANKPCYTPDGDELVELSIQVNELQRSLNELIEAHKGTQTVKASINTILKEFASPHGGFHA